MQIQEEHGLFPHITGKGDGARRVADLLLKMRQQAAASEDSNPTVSIGLAPSSSLESLIIIDRESDFATPLLTQLTYEGLVDEVFGIENSFLTIDSSLLGGSQGTAGTSQAKTQKIKLD